MYGPAFGNSRMTEVETRNAISNYALVSSAANKIDLAPRDDNDIRSRWRRWSAFLEVCEADKIGTPWSLKIVARVDDRMTAQVID